MSLSLAQSAIAFLIDLAEQGEIDPWDVNVIDVIDRFLKSLKDKPLPEVPDGRSPYEQNLSESGQAFLYAAMLVLLKADTLVRTEIEEAAEFEEEAFFEPSDIIVGELPRNLERHIHRRAVAAPPEKRNVTLQELIEQLETIAIAMADPTPRRRSRPQPQSKRKAVRAIAQLAHQENLSEIADALEDFLNRYWDELETLVDWIDFEYLLENWAQFRPDGLGGPIKSELSEADYRHEKVGVFWGLLFLSAQSKVELAQDAFYQDLKVRYLGHSGTELPNIPSYVLPD
ncbi:MAG: segregation/condensation protein A [Leptolyngbya sp. SIO4C1]|nr:segregation/condensation protein A [Leptolyngbya sp. SIO4C1]